MNAANTNTVLLGAIAGAGIVAAPAAASTGAGEQSIDSYSVDGGSHDALASTVTLDSSAIDGLTVTGFGPADFGAMPPAASHSAKFAGAEHVQSSLSDAHSQSAAPEMPQLSQGVEQPQAPAVSPVADAVGMPSAEMIAAAVAEAKGAAQPDSQSSAVVDKIVADALEGGAPQVDIDQVVAAVSGQSGGEDSALAALASVAHGAVPAWDMAAFAGFHNGHPMLNMEQMVAHPDAAPQV